MNETASNPRRLGVVAGAILVVAVVVAAIITTSRPVVDLDPNTPEGVIQSFFRAVEERNWDGVYTLLTVDLAADCQEYDLATTRYEFDRVVIDEVIPAGDHTIVVVEARRVDVTDPLNPYTYDEVMEFELENGNPPLISRLPWQFYCGG